MSSRLIYPAGLCNLLNITRRNLRQRPAAKLIGPNYNGNPRPIKLSMAMLKISIAQQQQKQQEGHTQH